MFERFRKYLGGIIVGGLLVLGFSAWAAPTGIDTFLDWVEQQVNQNTEDIAELQAEVFGASTTTTEVIVTTTTLPPTTTTTQETTTTTEPSSTELVIPATQPYVSGVQLRDAEGFNFMVGCLDTDDLDCQNNGRPNVLEEFTYAGHLMPYIYGELPPGLHDHAWWVPGDRERYVCAYAFMYDRHPNPFGGDIFHPDGHLIAKTAVIRPDGQSYGQVNDRYMEEGQRLFDGSIASSSDRSGRGSELTEDCRTEVEQEAGPFDYENYQPHGPDEVRVGLFRADGKIADIRDFTNKNFGLGSHLEFVSFENGIVHLVVILGLNDQVSHGIYYFPMNDGRIAVEVNGELVSES